MTLAGEIGLSDGDHLNGEAEVKGPGESESSVKDGDPFSEGIVKINTDPNCPPEETVERDEVGGEGDEPIDGVRLYKTAGIADFKGKNFSPRKVNRPGVSEFVTQNIDPERGREHEVERQKEAESSREAEQPDGTFLPGERPSMKKIRQREKLGRHEREQQKADEKLTPFHRLTS